MIRFFNVSKYYAGNPAVQNVDLRVYKGEFVFVTGPSGAGKTTLLRLMFGSERPSNGQILINGINLSRISRSSLDRLRRKMGFVFQDFKLLPRRTVFANVAVALEVLGERPRLIRRKTRQVLSLVGLGGKEDAFPLQLSGGEQQRVAIARAIVREPLIMLADEPTGNLDAALTEDIMVLFRSIHLQGTTVVIATHNQTLLQNTAQRTLQLERGRLVA